jgi:quercetin dioxygenase-like cupin family protein
MTIGTTSTGSYHLAGDEGPALWHLGGLLTFKATSDTTAGRLWVQEARGARGYASPLHSHAREDEAFYVLDGEIAVYVGDQTITATPGSFLWAPRDVPHAYCVESDEARFLALSTDSALDRFFFATGEPAGARTLPPPPEGPPDIPALVAALAEHGVEIVGPPPVPRA